MKVHLHHFSKIRSSKEVTKQYESRFFLLFLLAGRFREAQKHVDPDLDPEHREGVFLTLKNIAIAAEITSEGNGEEVAGGDGEPDGEWRAPLHVPGVVLVGGRREDGQHQHHRDQELNTHRLQGIHPNINIVAIIVKNYKKNAYWWSNYLYMS